MVKKNTLRLLLAGMLFFVFMSSVPIQAEVEKISFGAGPGFGPDYEGSDDYKLSPMLVGEFIWDSGRYVKLSGTRLRANILTHDILRFGPLANYRLGRDDAASIDDDVVERMRKVDDSLELGGFAGIQIDKWNFMVDAMSDASSGHEGFVLTLSTGYNWPVNDSWTLSFGASSNYADGDYMDSFFDVTPADSIASGLDVYSAGSGFKDVGCNIGALYKLSKKWNMRAVGRYTRLIGDAEDSPVVDDRGDADQFHLGVMLEYIFGREKEKIEEVTAPPLLPADSDGDGVYNDKDKCPDTLKGVNVDMYGCPMDSDGDGVPDYKDKCPSTPPLVKVDTSGCPLDSDGDGVYDYLDKCPGTPEGATVNKIGCWTYKGYVLFPVDKWNIKHEANSLMTEAVNILKKNPEMRLEVQGHTDSTGPAAYNQTLSEKRANAVMEYLVNKGIDSGRLEAKGYGESDPICSDETAQGRQKNRRVRFKRIN